MCSSFILYNKLFLFIQEKCGFGWHMFVECLAEGRGVSLPAGSVTAGRMGAVIGAYARSRKQFKVTH